MDNGLSTRDIKTIENILRKYPDVEAVHIFGSRAKGNFHKGSDIDLAVINKDIHEDTIRNLLLDFEDSTLPYFVDVVHYPHINASLQDHIDRLGQLLYSKDYATVVVHEKKPTYKKGDLPEERE